MTMPKNQAYSVRPHILVVDDDSRIRDLVCRYLEDHDFVVQTAGDAAHARSLLAGFAFDALVLDVMMPGESGVELTQYIHRTLKTPVLLLTALGEAEDRISGLEAGADDYLPKPFEPKELILRLNAILRRARAPVETMISFRLGEWVFQDDMDVLERGDDVIRLTSVEARLLRALADKAGEPVSRQDLAKACDLETSDRAIDVQVTRLRPKIEEDTKTPRYLQTVRGKGYLLRVERL